MVRLSKDTARGMEQAIPSVCFVVITPWRSASMWRVRMLAEGLAGRGGRVWMIVADDEDITEAPPPEGVEVARAPARPSGAFVAGAVEHLREIQPDYAHFLNPSQKACRIAKAKPGCRLLGDWEDWQPVCRFPLWMKPAIWWYDRWFRRRADVIVTASRWLSEEFGRRGRTDAHYIPYAPLPTQMPDLPSPFDQPTAVYMGGMWAYWDQQVVLDAAVLLKQRGATPAIRLIGDGPELERHRRFVAQHQLANVTMTGHLSLDDMLNNLRHAHVLLFPIADSPANRARCPLKVFQYAQAQRPIVTCRVGEVPQTLGDQARYVPCTPAAFAEAITEALDAPRQADIDYGLERQTWADRIDRLTTALQADQQALRGD
jgi:glycosyltransferase involved in cell wall biosynthesis